MHGFNNRFDDAVYRFAQIAHDAKAPAVRSCSLARSAKRSCAPTITTRSATYSRDALEDLLDMLAAQPGVSEINVLATRWATG